MVARPKITKRRPAEDDEPEEKPKRNTRRQVEEEPEDDKPTRGRGRGVRDDDPEDDKPARGRGRQQEPEDEGEGEEPEEDQDDRPRGRGRSPEPEDDEPEEKPKRGGRKARDEEEPEDDKPKRGSRRQAEPEDDVDDDKPKRGSRDQNQPVVGKAMEEDIAKHERLMDKSMDKLDELSKLAKIDKDDLDTELIEHPDIMFRVGDMFAFALSYRDQAKDMLKRQQGMAYERLRKNLTEPGNDDDKKSTGPKAPSEARIGAAMSNDTMVALFTHRVARWSLVTDRWEALKEAFKARGFVLKDLSALYVNNYFSTSTGSSGREASGRKADENKEKMAKEREGYRPRRDDRDNDDDRGSRRRPTREADDD